MPYCRPIVSDLHHRKFDGSQPREPSRRAKICEDSQLSMDNWEFVSIYGVYEFSWGLIGFPPGAPRFNQKTKTMTMTKTKRRAQVDSKTSPRCIPAIMGISREPPLPLSFESLRARGYVVGGGLRVPYHPGPWYVRTYVGFPTNLVWTFGAGGGALGRGSLLPRFVFTRTRHARHAGNTKHTQCPYVRTYVPTYVRTYLGITPSPHPLAHHPSPPSPPSPSPCFHTVDILARADPCGQDTP